MKLKNTLLFIILYLLNINFSFSQLPCENFTLSFDDTTCMSHLNIDTINCPQNIWQIGKIHKQGIDTTYFNSNVIITDTANPYPANNYSVFTIKYIVNYGDIYGFKMFFGNYFVNSDTLNDFGKIEFSPDNGITWIDMINDTTYSANFIWYSNKPVLTGNSGNWLYFDMVMADNGSVFNLQLGDTIIYRFSFKSDSIFDNRNGLLYDNIGFWNFVEGISEIRFKPVKSKIFPNPSADNFTIEFENPKAESYELAVYDIHSKLLLTKGSIKENKILIEGNLFKPGTYVYKLTNLKDKKRSWGKFVKI